MGVSKALVTWKDVEQTRRERISMRLCVKLLKALRTLIKEEGLITEDGRPYPLSWLIEDILIWVLSNPKRLNEFLDENFEEVEE